MDTIILDMEMYTVLRLVAVEATLITDYVPQQHHAPLRMALAKLRDLEGKREWLKRPEL